MRTGRVPGAFALVAVILGPFLLAVAVVLASLQARDDVPRFDVRVEPWGCTATVDWGGLSADQRVILGDALNACTAEHFPASDVRW